MNEVLTPEEAELVLPILELSRTALGTGGA